MKRHLARKRPPAAGKRLRAGILPTASRGLAALGLCLLLFPAFASETTKNAALTEQYAIKDKCAAYLQLLRASRISIKRAFAAAALETCPSNEGARQALEQAVTTDDAFVRRAALAALERHLNSSSLPFLFGLFGDPALAPAERELAYRYLARLATPERQGEMLDIFRRGLHETGRPCQGRPEQIHSLLGLGRIKAREEWPRIKAFLGCNLAAPVVAALESGRLLGLPAEQTDAVVRETRSLLRHRNAAIQAQAILLTDSLEGIAATESLIVLFARGAHELNQDLLYETLQRRIVRLKIQDVPGIAVRSARVRALPSERARIIGVLAPWSVLYRKKTEEKMHRLAPRRRLAAPDRWHQVSSREGFEGWVHGSEAEFFRFANE